MTADDRDVLTSLPRTRPTRRSAKRGGPAAAPATPATETPGEAVIETPTETPTEAVIETPTETPTEAVIETPTETPTEAVIETPIEAVIETPAETVSARPRATRPRATRPRATRPQAEPTAESPAPTTPPAGWASAAGEHDRWSLRGGGPLLRPAMRVTSAVAKLGVRLSRRMLAKLPKP